MKDTPTIFEQSARGRRALRLPPCDVDEGPLERLIGERYLRRLDAPLPEVGEFQVVRHYTRLSKRNMGVDDGFYPLGSCTMKYNPRLNETVASMSAFARVHPLAPESTVQGLLAILHALQGYLAEIAGLSAVSLQPAAGAHGELTSLMMIRAYHEERGRRPDTVLIPDSAHGTNPASCTLCGYRAVQVASDERGRVDVADLESKLDERVAALMITNPNTLGLFEDEIERICRLVHEAGGLVYLDGANLNAILGVTRPGDFGADVMHFNLHKTFSTPHGGGGPGAGPVAVSEHLAPYLPVPVVVEESGRYHLAHDRPRSIGKVRSFYGNAGILVRAYTYIRTLGSAGLHEVSETAVLNANYLLARISGSYDLAYGERCMHEFVIDATRQKKKGFRALDIAKCLLDHGFHPPTVYFPLIVPEAMMIEPTETETRETLDEFAAALEEIDRRGEEDPSTVTGAPRTTPVGRLDEVRAARQLVLRWQPGASGETTT